VAATRNLNCLLISRISYRAKDGSRKGDASQGQHANDGLKRNRLLGKLATLLPYNQYSSSIMLHNHVISDPIQVLKSIPSLALLFYVWIVTIWLCYICASFFLKRTIQCHFLRRVVLGTLPGKSACLIFRHHHIEQELG